MRTVLLSIAIAAVGASGCYSGAKSSDSDAGSVCEGKSSCAECLECANANPCAQLLDSCYNNSACVGLSDCIALCGSDLSCQQQCSTGNPQGVGTYNALRECQYCEQCPDDCSGYAECD